MFALLFVLFILCIYVWLKLNLLHALCSFWMCFASQKVQGQLEGLKKDLDKVSVKTQQVLASPQQSASAPVLRSELELTVQKMDHAYMLSSVYLEK